MAAHVLVEKKSGVLNIKLNRPEKKNALSMEMYELMNDGLVEAAKDESVRVVLIHAAGGDFCSGNDMADFSAANQGKYELADFPSLRFMKNLLHFEKPVVAAVKGHAVGIGATMLMHCDVVVVGRSATFSMPFTKLGLIPEFGSTYLLPRIAGKAPASQVLLLGESFGVERAEQFGMISTICEDSEVDEKAAEKCQVAAGLPPNTLRQVKKLINSAIKSDELEQAVDTELQLFAQALKSDEHRQALKAFFAKKH